jgi:molecular chaperone DnaK (HSP70)
MKTDNKDKISEEDVKKIDEAVEIAKKTVTDEKAEKDAIEKAAKDLTEAIMPIGAKDVRRCS